MPLASPAAAFQSTPPARGATGGVMGWIKTTKISIHAPREGGDYSAPRPADQRSCHFNPRPPRGGRHARAAGKSVGDLISIHAPREGGDFQPLFFIHAVAISIHAPREGGDQTHY